MQDTASQRFRTGDVASRSGSAFLAPGPVVTAVGVAPQGRKGLWDALARAAAGAPGRTRYPVDAALAVEPVCEEDELDIEPRPHLAYLSRLAGIDEPETEVAPVVSLADYRARRH